MTDKPEGQLLDHNYDGIQELNNPLPRWWVYLFVGTVIFGVIYGWYYWFGPGLSLEEKLAVEMAKDAEMAKKNTSELVVGIRPDLIDQGQKVFVAKCGVCHGQRGEGLIGPNLTDNYWVHGKGDIDSIVLVVQKGVIEKGMLAWETQLSPEDILAVSNYIVSIKGTAPKNAKKPEGQPVK